MTMTMKEGKCDCGKTFQYQPIEFMGREMFSSRRCPDCSDAIVRRLQEEDKLSKLDALEAQWKQLCPAGILAFDGSKLPNPSAYDEALEWDFKKSLGLMLTGASRSGKSRTAWQILRREHFHGRRVASMTGLDVVRYVGNLMDDSIEASGWLDEMAEADMLLLDDCFKATMTKRAEEAVFTIVDHRTQHGLPMIVTLNDSPESLEARLSEDRGAPLVARLKEFCEVLKV